MIRPLDYYKLQMRLFEKAKRKKEIEKIDKELKAKYGNEEPK